VAGMNSRCRKLAEMICLTVAQQRVQQEQTQQDPCFHYQLDCRTCLESGTQHRSGSQQENRDHVHSNQSSPPPLSPRHDTQSAHDGVHICLQQPIKQAS
jgi:hypothetical protein